MKQVKFILLIIVMFVIGGIFASIVSTQITQLPMNTISSETFRESKLPDVNVTKFSIDHPPEQSLIGNILEKSGDVLWQSRSATESAQMPNLDFIQQGEIVKTGENSSLKVGFGEYASIELLPFSELNIIQTLPYNIVFQQSEGEILYETIGISPISIRTYRLVTRTENGIIKISIDENNNSKVFVQAGNADVAYNSSEFVSQVIPLAAGQTFSFNNDKREGSVE